MKVTGIRISLVILVNVILALGNNIDPPKRYDKKAKSVTTIVSAKWEATPVVLELAEYLSGESSDLFWSFVDGINSLKTSLDSLGKILFLIFYEEHDLKKPITYVSLYIFLATDKQVYDACIGVASTLLAPAQLRMAKLALSMHTTSPTVRMFNQIATQNGAKDVQCDTFVAIASTKVCDNDVLRDILKLYSQYDPVSFMFVFSCYLNIVVLCVSPISEGKFT